MLSNTNVYVLSINTINKYIYILTPITRCLSLKSQTNFFF